MFLSLLRKVKLPDAEFVFNLGDWPLEENLTDPQPIWTWCGSSNTSDIALPTWDQTKNTRHALFRERKDIQYVEQISGRSSDFLDENKLNVNFDNFNFNLRNRICQKL